MDSFNAFTQKIWKYRIDLAKAIKIKDEVDDIGALLSAQSLLNQIIIHLFKNRIETPDISIFNQGITCLINERGQNEILGIFQEFTWKLDYNSQENGASIITPSILSYTYEKFTIPIASLNEIKVSIDITDKNFQLKGDFLKFGNKKIGAFYTPEVITSFIANATVYPFILEKLNIKFKLGLKESFIGDLEKFNLNELTIEQIIYVYNDLLKKLRIADIASGSGAFLIAALDVIFKLSKACLEEIKNLNEFKQEFDELNCDSGLAYNLKKRILETNLYGVDVQPEALEITKLILYFSLFTENNSEIDEISSISFNLRSGNSLLGRISLNDKDYVNKINKLDEITPKDLENLKIFNWNDEFSDFEGFDIIIGNPPYIENKKMKGKLIHKDLQKELFDSAYKLYDYSVLFIERCYQLLKEGGYVGLIVPNKFCATDYGIKTRNLLLEKTEIKLLLNVSKLDIFKKVATYPVIICFKKQLPAEENDVLIEEIINLQDLDSIKYHIYTKIKQSTFKNLPERILALSPYLQLAEKIRNQEGILPLRDLGGEQMGYRLFGFTKYDRIYEKIRDTLPDNQEHYKFIGTRNIKNFAVDESIPFVSKGYRLLRGILVYEREFEPFWKYFSKEKLLIKEVSKSLTVAFDPGIYSNTTGMYLFIPEENEFGISLFYLLGVLNSRLMNFIYNTYYGTTHMAGGYLNFHRTYLLFLPIKVPSKEEARSIELLSKILFVLAKYKHKMLKDMLEVLNVVVYELYFGNSYSKEYIEVFYKDFNEFEKEILDSPLEDIVDMASSILKYDPLENLKNSLMDNSDIKFIHKNF